MILSSKQLEELETLTSGSLEFDEASSSSEETESTDEGTEGALAWRRGMIERALGTVRKAQKRAADGEQVTKPGTLIYDEGKKVFARVGEAVVAYAVSAQMVERNTKVDSTEKKKHVAKVSAETTSAAPAKKMTKEKAAATQSVPKAVKKEQRKPVASIKTPEKKPVKKHATAVKGVILRTKANPKQDPNTYIKQNFQRMSNKELSKVTGFSEHTIRRKLGEWGMRRVK